MRRRYDVACQVGYYNRLIEEWRKKSDDNFVVGALLTGLSKTFDCIPHDLSIAKRAAYGLSEKELVYILSYLSNRKQCVRITIAMCFKIKLRVSLRALYWVLFCSIYQ